MSMSMSTQSFNDTKLTAVALAMNDLSRKATVDSNDLYIDTFNIRSNEIDIKPTLSYISSPSHTDDMIYIDHDYPSSLSAIIISPLTPTSSDNSNQSIASISSPNSMKNKKHFKNSKNTCFSDNLQLVGIPSSQTSSCTVISSICSDVSPIISPIISPRNKTPEHRKSPIPDFLQNPQKKTKKCLGLKLVMRKKKKHKKKKTEKNPYSLKRIKSPVLIKKNSGQLFIEYKTDKNKPTSKNVKVVLPKAIRKTTATDTRSKHLNNNYKHKNGKPETVIASSNVFPRNNFKVEYDEYSVETNDGFIFFNLSNNY